MEGVETTTTPKITTRSGQRAAVEISAPKVGPPRPGMKFDVLAELAADGRIQLAFAYTSEFPDGDKIKTRVLKSNVSLEPGHTLLLRGTKGAPGRETLVTVTASLVAPEKLDPAKPIAPEERPPGKKIPGKPGFVTNPFAPEAGEIDVRGLPPGTEIEDPHSGKRFFVPDDEPATLERAKRIVIPRLTFKEATVPEALDFLTMKARDLDPEKKGVNLVLKPGPETGTIKITIDLRDIPFTEALKYITSLANLKFRYEEEAVVIVPLEP